MHRIFVLLALAACLVGLVTAATMAPVFQPNPNTIGAIASLRGGSAAYTCSGSVTFTESSSGDSTTDVEYYVTGLGNYANQALGFGIYENANIGSIGSVTYNTIFYNSTQPRPTTPCAMDAVGWLPYGFVYTSTISTSYTGLYVKLTGVDSIVGRLVVVWNNQPTCDSPNSFNSSAVACYGVIGYNPASKTGSSNANTATTNTALNATVPVYGQMWNAGVQLWDIVTGTFNFYQNGDTVGVYGVIASTAPIGSVRVMSSDGSAVFGSTIGDYHYPFGHPSQMPGVLGSLTQISAATRNYYYRYRETGLTKISLVGANSIIGYNLTIFANADDGCTQPDGRIGASMAWGFIGYNAKEDYEPYASDWARQTKITCPVPTAGAAPTATQSKATKTSFEVNIAIGEPTLGCIPSTVQIQQMKDAGWDTVHEVQLYSNLASYTFTCLEAGKSYKLRFVTKHTCSASSPAGAGTKDSTPSEEVVFKTIAPDARAITFSVKDCNKWYSCFAFKCGSTTDSCNNEVNTFTIAPGEFAEFDSTTQDSSYFQGKRVKATISAEGQLCFNWKYTYGTSSSTQVSDKSECYTVSGLSAGSYLGSIETAYDNNSPCFECTSVTTTYRSEISFVSAGQFNEPVCTGNALLTGYNSAASLAVSLSFIIAVAIATSMYNMF